jgi:hypothetical protein
MPKSAITSANRATVMAQALSTSFRWVHGLLPRSRNRAHSSDTADQVIRGVAAVVADHAVDDRDQPEHQRGSEPPEDLVAGVGGDAVAHEGA